MKYLYNANDFSKNKEHKEIEQRLGSTLKTIMQFFNSNYNDLTKIGFGSALREYGKAYDSYSRYKQRGDA